MLPTYGDSAAVFQALRVRPNHVFIYLSRRLLPQLTCPLGQHPAHCSMQQQATAILEMTLSKINNYKEIQTGIPFSLHINVLENDLQL